MKRRALWTAVVLSIALVSYLGLTQSGPAAGSSLSRASSGWSVARQYLDGQDVLTNTLEEPVGDQLEKFSVLVMAGSAERSFSSHEREALNRFLLAGGHVIFGYSHGPASRSSVEEILGVELLESASRNKSVNPFVWKRDAFAEHRYPAESDGFSVAMYAVEEYPAKQAGDEVLLRNDKGEGLVVLRAQGKGEILMVPAEVFSNGRLKEPGNAALLESIRAHFASDEWTFDEYHHGVVAATSPAGLKSGRALDLFIFQLVLAYVFFVVATGRRFGPEWPEPRAASGATGHFLTTIAAIHERLGHHADAAEALEQRAKQVLGVEIRPNSGVVGKQALTNVARLLKEAQRGDRV